VFDFPGILAHRVGGVNEAGAASHPAPELADTAEFIQQADYSVLRMCPGDRVFDRFLFKTTLSANFKDCVSQGKCRRDDLVRILQQ